MTRLLPPAVLLGVLLAGKTAAARDDWSVDLHAHLFMKEGLGALFRGSFDEPLAADSWDDRLSSKVNAATLESSRAAIVVVAIFAHPLFVWDTRQAVRNQIAAAEAWARRPGWGLAKSAAEAQRLLRQGKRVLVLSLEGVGGVLESEEDLREFIDERGIRIVAPLHLVDDRVGGAALLAGSEIVGNPLGLIDQLLDPHVDDGVFVNRRGLSPHGRRLVRELLRRGVWIDLTHASDQAFDDTLPMLRAAGQPPLVTHTTLRRYRGAERALSDRQLAAIARERGIVGLMPSAPAMGEVPVAKCPQGCDCRQGIHAFLALYREAARALGDDAVMLGSDWNGGMRHLPRSCGTGTSLDAPAGFYHMGQQHELWSALRRLGAAMPPRTERFVKTWARVRPVPLDDGGLPPLPARAERAGLSLRLGAGMGSTGNADPGLTAFARMRLHKDPGERVLYLLAVEGDVTVALERTGVAHAFVRAAPVGVSAEIDDNRAVLEAFPMRIARHVPLDQSFVAQPSLLRAEIRTMPGILKQPGCSNLFVGIESDVLGYKHVSYLSDRRSLDALHFVGGGLSLGGRSWFERDVFASLEARAFIDANLIFPEAELQTDAWLAGRFVLGFAPQGAELFWQTSWLGTLDERAPDYAASALRHFGGVMATLF